MGSSSSVQPQTHAHYATSVAFIKDDIELLLKMIKTAETPSDASPEQALEQAVHRLELTDGAVIARATLDTIENAIRLAKRHSAFKT